MGGEINSVWIQNLLWFEINEGRISFRLSGFPKDVHITISYNKNSPYTNLHVTKNTEDRNNKPKIYIFIIDRVELGEYFELFVKAAITKMLRQVNLSRFYKKYGKGKYYISCDELEKDKDSYVKIENQFQLYFKDGTKVKRKRVEIKNAEERLIRFGCSEELKLLAIDHLRRFKGKLPESTNSFLLLSKKKVLHFIKINGRWFNMYNDLTLASLLTSFIKPDIARHLIYKTLRAIKKIENAKKVEDVVKYNQPMALFVEKAG